MGAPEAFTATTDVGHYIGGRIVPGTSGRQQPVYNPSTGKVARQLALASAAEVEAAVASPHYAALARAVAEDHAVLDFLLDLPRPKRQPNLFFAVLRVLGGVPADGAELRARVEADPERIRQEMLARATQ